MFLILVLVGLFLFTYAHVDSKNGEVGGQRFTFVHAGVVFLTFAVILRVIRESTSGGDDFGHFEEEKLAWYYSSHVWFYLGLAWCVLVAASAYYMAQSESTRPLISSSAMIDIFSIGLAFCWGAAVIAAFLEKTGMTEHLGNKKGFLESFLPFL